jgi:hypothetical protein
MVSSQKHNKIADDESSEMWKDETIDLLRVRDNKIKGLAENRKLDHQK